MCSIPGARTFGELFSARAALSPDAIAVDTGTRMLTYAELARKADAVACALSRRGVTAETVVGVAAQRTPEWVVAVVGILRAGAVYLPLDNTHPAERLAFQLADSGASLVLTDEPVGWPADSALPVLPIEELAAARGQGHADTSTPANTAYLVYTSGSTGRPKGVAVTHRGLACLASAQARHLRVSARSRILQFASPGFDASVWELCMALLNGAALLLAGRDDVAPGGPLARTVDRLGPTHLTLPPPVLAAMPVGSMSAVECLVVAGDAITAELAGRWSAGRVLVNAYGPTETTVCATMSRPLGPGTGVPIGTPVLGTRVHVLDEHLRPVEAGAAGELYVSGPAVARGYVGRTALTATRFVADPFGGPGDRLYRTGDVVESGQDGVLRFLGRADDQVKIGGVRVEPLEVRAVLAAHPGVADALVLAGPGRNGAVRLVAYVVAADPAGPESPAGAYGTIAMDSGFLASELRAHLARRLPPAMVPAAFVPIPRMPLTPNGKPDVAALPEPASVRPGHRAPATPEETVLTELFAEALGLDDVGADDDFFVIGGDSIQSIRVVSGARAAGVGITTGEVFEHRTPARLARLASTRGATRVATEHDADGSGEFPLLPVARWLRGRGPGFSSFLQAAALRLPEGAGEPELTAALGAVVDRHDLLRARVSGDIVVVAPPGSGYPPLRWVACPGPWEDLLAAELTRAAAELDPADGRVARWIWFDARPGVLLLVLHHAVVDGVSWRILRADLAQAWTGGALPPVPTSMRRWARALAEDAAGPRRHDELPYWLSVTDGPDPLLGTCSLDPAVDVHATVAETTVRLDSDLTGRLLATLPSAFRVSVEETLLTALGLALACRWRDTGRGTPPTLVRLERHGREESVLPGADLSRTVGWFTSVHPLRLDVTGLDLDEAFAGGPAAGSALKRVKETLRAVPDRGIGYGQLAHLAPGVPARLAGAPLGRIGFNYLGRFPGPSEEDWAAIDVPELAMLDVADPAMPALAELDLNARVVDHADGPVLTAVFAAPRGVLDPAEVAAVAQLWTSAVESLVRHAEQPGGSGLSPSDVLCRNVSRRDLDAWVERWPGLADVWPLTSLQSGLLYHNLAVDSEFDAYQVQYSLRLVGPLDAGRLRVAGQALLDRHEGLRAVFVPDSTGELVQLVLSEVELPWRTRDLRGAAADAFAQLLADDLAEHFDLAEPPLLRATLVRAGDEEHELVLTAHHVLFDGWSLPLLVLDLLRLYAGVDLPMPRSQRDYLRWLESRTAGESARVWSAELAGVTRPTLASAEVPEQVPGVAKVDVPLDSAVAGRLTGVASGLGVTVNTVVQSAWAVLLSKFTGRADVVFGAAVSGRPPVVPGIDAVVGMLLNTISVRVVLDPDRTVAEQLAALQSAQAALVDHHHHALGDIHRATGVDPLFDTIVGYESFPLDRAAIAEAGAAAGVVLTGIRSFTASHYPLTVLIFVHPGLPLRIALQYQRGIPHGWAAEVAGRFAAVLHQVAAKPELPLAAIDVLTPEEVRRLTGPVAGESPAPLELFGTRVRATPDAVAVTSGAVALSYRELDERSNALAAELAGRGVTVETPVTVRVPPSAEFVVAVLAVLKAGGCLAGETAVEVTEVLSQRAESPPAVLVRPGQLACVSPGPWLDGTPRAVGISHRALAARMAAAAPAARLVTGLTGDLGDRLPDLLAALCSGAGVVVADGAGPLAADGAVLRLNLDEAATVVRDATERIGADAVRVHGGVPGAELVRSLKEVAPRAEVRAVASLLETGPTAMGEPGAAGTALDGVRLLVLDPALRMSPPGAVGELYVAGPGVARGYPADAAGTAGRFPADPFGPPGARMVRTGELVRRTTAGVVEPVGRADNLVVLGGLLTDLAPAAVAVTALPGVRDAAAAITEVGGIGRVVVYAVADPARQALIAETAGAALPVRPEVVLVDAIPRTPAGAVDTAALVRPGAAPAYRPPRTPEEKTLCALFAKVLSADEVGLDDDFYTLGGDSVLATRITSRIRAELGVDVPIRAVIQSRGVAELARTVKDASGTRRLALRKMNRSAR